MMLEQKTSEVRLIIEEHICVVSLDNTLKKNAITPELMSQLSAHLTSFEDDDNLWVAIIDPAGEHTTAGLTCPSSSAPPRRSRSRSGLRATKKAALTYLEQGERAAVEAIPSIQNAVFATEDFKEGIQSFVERREARFQGR